MKQRLRVTIFVVIGLAICVFMFWHRGYLIAEGWHWIHGNSIMVGTYFIPVPAHWIARQSDGPNKALLFDLRKTQGFEFGARVAVISIDLSRQAPQNLDDWAAAVRGRMEDRGLIEVVERKFSSSDNALNFDCLGGTEFKDEMHIPSNAVSISCWSNSPLGLRFVGDGSQTNEIYSIASGIRERRSGG